MTSLSPPIYLFATHREAEHAIRTLASTGFNVKHLSLVGTGVQSAEHPAQLYTVAGRIRAWSGVGAFWGGVWGMLLAPAVFFLPGLGPVAMSGPLASTMVKAMENPSARAGATALDTALTETGVKPDGLLQFETALRAEKYALIVHGTAEEVQQIDLFLAAHRYIPIATTSDVAPAALATGLNGDHVDIAGRAAHHSA